MRRYSHVLTLGVLAALLMLLPFQWIGNTFAEEPEATPAAVLEEETVEPETTEEALPEVMEETPVEETPVIEETPVVEEIPVVEEEPVGEPIPEESEPTVVPTMPLTFVLPSGAACQWSVVQENSAVDLINELGIRAMDENQVPVAVYVKDQGNLDLTQAGTYTIVVGAINPVTTEEETASFELTLQGEEIATPMDEDLPVHSNEENYGGVTFNNVTVYYDGTVKTPAHLNYTYGINGSFIESAQIAVKYTSPAGIVSTVLTETYTNPGSGVDGKQAATEGLVQSINQAIDQSITQLTGHYDIEFSAVLKNNHEETNNTTIGVRILTYVQRPITIHSASSSKLYNGTALRDYTITVDNLAEGDSLQADATGSQTEVGSSLNTIENVRIVNAANEDVTSNYAITYDLGTLTVTIQYALIIDGHRPNGEPQDEYIVENYDVPLGTKVFLYDFDNYMLDMYQVTSSDYVQVSGSSMNGGLRILLPDQTPQDSANYGFDGYRVTINGEGNYECYPQSRAYTINSLSIHTNLEQAATIVHSDLMGDLNNDGRVDGQDQLLFYQGVDSSDKVTDFSNVRADMNYDGLFTVTDIAILNMVLGGTTSGDSFYVASQAKPGYHLTSITVDGMEMDAQYFETSDSTPSRNPADYGMNPYGRSTHVEVRTMGDTAYVIGYAAGQGSVIFNYAPNPIPPTPTTPEPGRSCQDDGYPEGYYWNGTACVTNATPTPTATPTVRPTARPSATPTATAKVSMEPTVAPNKTPEIAAIVAGDASHPGYGDGEGHWSFVNLLAAISSMVLGVVHIVKANRKEEDEKNVLGENELKEYRRSNILKVCTATLGLTSIVIFVLTQKMTKSMVWFDQYTWILLILTAASCFTYLAGLHWKENKVEE